MIKNKTLKEPLFKTFKERIEYEVYDSRKIELMKIIISDEFNLLKDENQSIDDYELEKKSYKKIVGSISNNNKSEVK
jgi:hypothetical protein